MAEYDPTAPMPYEAGNRLELGDQEDEYQFDQAEAEAEAEAEDEDDDYDPSSFNFGDDESDANINNIPDAPVQQNRAPSTDEQALRPPKTVGGFIVDDEDEEEQDVMAPPPSQLNGTEGAQSGLGAVAVSEAVQDIPIASEPSQEDTAAVTSAATQSAPLNGSSSNVLPPVSNIPAQASASAPDVAPSVSATSLQSPNTEQGKQQPAITSTTVSAVQSVAATPQPPIAAAIAPPQTNGSIPPTPTAQRLPHDKVGQLEDRIKEDPKADTDAWRSLIQHYRDKGQFDSARKVYSRFFDVFPTAASIWVEYTQMELEQNALGNVEAIFNMSLIQLPSVDMWTVYLDYLRRIHPLINDADGTRRGILSQAFEMLLNNVGIDPNAGNLWRDYVDFVKSGPGVIGGTGWQDAQKMDLLRKAYQRAVKLPHGELTKLWKEYDNFELGINKATGRKFLQEQSPHYMTARTAKTQLDNKIEGLRRKQLPILPPLYGCAGEDDFASQVEMWRGWLEWEKEDPLVLKDEDIAAYRKRINYVYKQATMQLRFYPEIWFEASAWCFEQGTDEMEAQGTKFLDEGIEACPESVLLALKKADRVESVLDSGNTDEIAIRNGELLDVPFENVLKALYALHKKMTERMNKSVAEVQQYYASLSPAEDGVNEVEVQEDDEDEDSPNQKPQSRAEQMKAQIEAVRAAAQDHLDTLKRTISYVWVAKLRAFRRVQSQGQPGKPKKGFRGVFAEARPRGQLTSEVYIANALMEWRCYQDASANKIFERGLKLFPTDEVFALEYIKHLLSNNDDTNARAVFETTLTKITNSASISAQQQAEKCRPLLNYMHTFESNYGDLDKIQRLERRMKEMIPGEPDVVRFGSRYALPSFDALIVQLVISPTQARPKSASELMSQQQQYRQAKPSIEEFGRSPPENNLRLGPNGPYIQSPKRALDDSDSEAPARKFMRAESPLKGAAGRRIQNQTGPTVQHNATNSGGGGGFMTKSYVPPTAAAAPVAVSGQTPLPYSIHDLMNKIPGARYWQATMFDPGKMVELLRGVNLQNVRV